MAVAAFWAWVLGANNQRVNTAQRETSQNAFDFIASSRANNQTYPRKLSSGCSGKTYLIFRLSSFRPGRGTVRLRGGALPTREGCSSERRFMRIIDPVPSKVNRERAQHRFGRVGALTA